MSSPRVLRLTAGDREIARATFAMMADVFDEEHGPLSDRYLDRLLTRQDFWAFAAIIDDEIVGGLTAHTLPMTRVEASEVLIYDVGVRSDWRRKGVGRRLLAAVQDAAAAEGMDELWVPADDEDEHALRFYAAVGGTPARVTHFTFSRGSQRGSDGGS
jgi:aminoglycoside 3-N-acetyltransferase I